MGRDSSPLDTTPSTASEKKVKEVEKKKDEILGDPFHQERNDNYRIVPSVGLYTQWNQQENSRDVVNTVYQSTIVII